MRMRGWTAVWLTIVLAVTGAQVVAQVRGTSYESYSHDGRWYLVKLDGEEKVQQSDWGSGDRLRKYADANAGSYIVFLADGSLYRLSDQKQLREIATLYEPLRQLSKQQAALGAAQRPLGSQQKLLGEQMRETHDPATQGRIGAAQGTLGRAQGEIGRQQGILGRQQGELSAVLNERVQTMIDACLKDKSCPMVVAKT